MFFTRIPEKPFLELRKIKTMVNAIDENTGLMLNSDGTVTFYHHTSAHAALAIRNTSILKADAEPTFM